MMDDRKNKKVDDYWRWVTEKDYMRRQANRNRRKFLEAMLWFEIKYASHDKLNRIISDWEGYSFLDDELNEKFKFLKACR